METATAVRTKWTADTAHSEIGFKVRHMMMTNVKGFFTRYTIDVETAGNDFANASILFSADALSITTNNEQRDAHLRSQDFFGHGDNPQITFKGKRYEQTGEETFVLTGDLTINEITKEITLDVEYGGIGKDPWGNDKAGFVITGKINRKDWNINWNATLETGGLLVSDEVRINCDVQLQKAQ